MFQINDLIYLIHVQDFNNIKKCTITEINEDNLILKDFDEELYYQYNYKNKTLGIRIFKNKKQFFGVFNFEILDNEEKDILYYSSKLNKDIKNIANQVRFLENKSSIDNIEYVNGLKILLDKMSKTLENTNLMNKNPKFVRA